MNRVGASLVALALASCSTVGEFTTDSSEPYVGSVLGQSDPGCDAGTGCSFLRRGFRSGTELVMTFDASAGGGIAGALDTRTTDGSAELCEPTLTNALLREVEPLAHDALSQLTFPGDGRLRTFIYSIDAQSGPFATRDAYAFVSLMRSGELEVRILAGSGRNDCAPTDCAAYSNHTCDFFGVFHLKREPAAP